MTSTSIQPHLVTSPIQVVAAFLAALVLVEGSIFGAVAAMDDPEWIRATLTIAGVASIPAFVAAPFLLLTKFRPQIQGDPYYARWLARTAPAFQDFQAENIEPRVSRIEPLPISESSDEREAQRISIYERHRGLFLVHTWRPSIEEGQVADIVIELRQHTHPGGEAPLHQGLIESVEYQLGTKFFDETVVKTNSHENFRLEVSAYAPMLGLARVNFTDGTEPLDLDRYIDFPAP